ncbi:hypothetical protein COCC4DRAFT_34576 [Bipolaris maydis ATCC 48331]|uniref:Uncharacterized protein n=2 Tax=Cochliobolus heterostrophus TaxID=5016 RepID=M2SJP9_COCH5|nr:uncharacterized protein COCC4DRAFT_34576 [Bipolaris maydis ATCC 48331]EMD85560.1 hypothetical protein COCHEDRAFT_1024470 [Bipolaris maydis C5]ENH99986.1 hypothetical protein COCC4DRAFT_34576 [Bipolaris maydis ATCC 48331]
MLYNRGYVLRMYDPWSVRAWGTRYAFQPTCDPLPCRAATLSRDLVGPKSDTSACGVAHALDALGREPFSLSKQLVNVAVVEYRPRFITQQGRPRSSCGP